MGFLLNYLSGKSNFVDRHKDKISDLVNTGFWIILIIMGIYLNWFLRADCDIARITEEYTCFCYPKNNINYSDIGFILTENSSSIRLSSTDPSSISGISPEFSDS